MAVQDLKIVRWFVNLARNSPWLMIAIGLHVIVAAVASLVIIHSGLKKSNDAATEIGVSASRSAPVEVIQPPEEIDRKKIPENEVQAELVTFEEETTFVPTEEEVPEDLYLDLGDPTGSDDGSEASTGGTSIGVGTGGHYGTGTPSSFLSRRAGSATRAKKGRPPKGATVGTEEAVLEGLRWLLRHQNEDGSWTAASIHTHCTNTPCIPPDPSLDSSYDVGMTALALLAFLGQGISIGSKVEIVDTAMGKRYQAGDVVKRGVRWLMDRQKEEGYFSDSLPFDFPENETLSTMVLCEAYGLSRNRELKRPAQKALDFLVDAQKRTPEGARWGWGYGSYKDIEARYAAGTINDENYQAALQEVDLNRTSWVAMALRSAQSCGLTVADDVLQGALSFALAKQDEITNPELAPAPSADDKFAYHALGAAQGMLTRAFVSQDLSDPYHEKAAKVLAQDVPHVSKDGLSVDFHFWYFATMALNQFDGPDSPRKGQGEYWDPWNEGLIKSLLPLQDETKERNACSRGGWLTEARGAERGRALYNTAMNVLTLEVYYRFENVFGAVGKAAPGGPATGSPSKPPASPSKPR